ncbi:hypothetical protein PS1_043991 [Malus domestica]
MDPLSALRDFTVCSDLDKIVRVDSEFRFGSVYGFLTTQRPPTAPSKAISTPSKPSFITSTDHTPTIPTAANIGSSRSSENEVHTTTTTTSVAKTKRQARQEEHRFDTEEQGLSLKDFFEQAKGFISSDGGPPRWFSHLSGG